MKPLTLSAIAVTAAALVLGIVLQPAEPEAPGITMPDLSATALVGQTLFDENCAACHGAAGSGTDQGPPLIHVIYEPSHHGDRAFLIAAQYGVRAHHWQFGNMPPVEGVTPEDVMQIVAYVREVQRANGIK
ncbi:MAG: c-type cytochrome [Mangrovicoccus sp.]